jgi:hypothetical protein
MQHLDSGQILRFVLSMFSAEEVLLLPMSSVKGWSLRLRCCRCQLSEGFTAEIDRAVRGMPRQIVR